MKTRCFILLLLSAITIGGCSSSTNSPAPFTIAGAPAPGSSYTYHVIAYNYDGSKANEGDNTVHVTSHEQSWNGRQNVVLFDSSRGMIYESNGDFSVFIHNDQNPNPPQWIRFPAGGGGDYTIIFEDDATAHDVAVTHFVGSESMTINGVTTDTKHVRLADTVTITDLFGNATKYPLIVDYWYAPSAKYFARQDESAWTEPLFPINKHGRTTGTLTSYTLK